MYDVYWKFSYYLLLIKILIWFFYQWSSATSISSKFYLKSLTISDFWSNFFICFWFNVLHILVVNLNLNFLAAVVCWKVCSWTCILILAIWWQKNGIGICYIMSDIFSKLDFLLNTLSWIFIIFVHDNLYVKEKSQFHSSLGPLIYRFALSQKLFAPVLYFSPALCAVYWHNQICHLCFCYERTV